jgi:uncharacterized repeat protein (TIGR03803 family)
MRLVSVVLVLGLGATVAGCSQPSMSPPLQSPMIRRDAVRSPAQAATTVRFYGTTAGGGTYGNGTVFSVSTTGVERVLYSFKGYPDGADPLGSVIEVNGKLYGTTSGGGGDCYPHGCGTIFSLTTKGVERVLYSFTGGPDGRFPSAGLIDVSGTLYGTAANGGLNPPFGDPSGCPEFYSSGSSDAPGCGTIFSVSTTGKLQILHSFASGTDGGNPSSNLVDVHGTLYGTTTYGGGTGCPIISFGNGCGTVFAITPSGTERIVHRFGLNAADGAEPGASLIEIKGVLYGTSVYGGGRGGSSCATMGCGTVFSVTPGAVERVLHRFSGGEDGAMPLSSLVDIRGMLYGTTQAGGGEGSCDVSTLAPGCGTIFSVSTTGAERVLHRFDDADGAIPTAGMSAIDGVVYGTASYGNSCGTYLGCGTFFTTTTSGTLRVLHRFGTRARDGIRPSASLSAT